MANKIIGYTLLGLGLIIIFASAFSVYQVFTRQAEPVKLFNFPGISFDPAKFMPNSANLSLPPEVSQYLKQGQIEEKTTAGKTELVPADMINSSSNIFAHLFLMGFLATVGYRLASLGIKLVRPIVVHLKAKEISAYEPQVAQPSQ